MKERDRAVMDAIFKPTSVAVIGASDNASKLGSHVMKSLIHGGYPGTIYPVNPGRKNIMGMKSYPSIVDVPESVDLAVIVVPAEQVPGAIGECNKKNVKGVVLITAGFKEIEDSKGEMLQRELARSADRFGIKIIGPNTFGIVNLHLPLNASFTPQFSQLKKGKISLISQSGGMSHLIGFLALQEDIGLSKIIGLGNRCNVDFAEAAEYLVEDPDSEVIAMYLEGLDHPRELIDVAKTARHRKPMIAYKVGRSRTGDKASRLHTGSLAGKQEIYEAAFRQARILTVQSSEELLDTSKAVTIGRIPKGNRIAVLSGQAGPAMAACDVCELEGRSVPPFSRKTQEAIEALLPPLAIRTNPVDLGPAWYDSESLKGIVQAALDDNKTDALLLCMMFASANHASAALLSELVLEKRGSKPIVSCLSAPAGIWDPEIQLFEEAGVPNFPTPERAAKALANLCKIGELRSS